MSALLLSLALLGAEERPPNFVVVFCDDLGYGDLSCFGHPTLHTPHLDRMAAEGTKLTQFYAAASVCTPSRAGLLTGRLPIRSGMCGDRRRVLFPDSKGGLPANEVTIAEGLKSAGYATACVGKWHLGHLPEYLPTEHGFDSYWGIPYSNDMDRQGKDRGHAEYREVANFDVPIVEDKQVVERPADQHTITRRYTDKAIEFIASAGDRPFFLYLAHSMPHIPLFTNDEFRGASRRGLYGDVVEEIDHGVGRILDHLRDNGLAENTLVVFTSDNGPWLVMDEAGGSAGLLRDGKGCTWDGGMREPTIVWQPGTVPAGRVAAGLSSTLDLLPTFFAQAGVDLPDAPLDGIDQTALLHGGDTARDEFFYYRGTRLMAVRLGPHKAHFITQGAYGQAARNPVAHDPPLVFDLETDPSERHPLKSPPADLLARIDTAVQKHRATVQPPPSQLDR